MVRPPCGSTNWSLRGEGQKRGKRYIKINLPNVCAGIADAVGFDLNHDGHIDALDTNHDGKMDKFIRHKAAPPPRSAPKQQRGARLLQRRRGHSLAPEHARPNTAPTPQNLAGQYTPSGAKSPRPCRAAGAALCASASTSASARRAARCAQCGSVTRSLSAACAGRPSTSGHAPGARSHTRAASAAPDDSWHRTHRSVARRTERRWKEGLRDKVGLLLDQVEHDTRGGGAGTTATEGDAEIRIDLFRNMFEEVIEEFTTYRPMWSRMKVCPAARPAPPSTRVAVRTAARDSRYRWGPAFRPADFWFELSPSALFERAFSAG